MSNIQRQLLKQLAAHGYKRPVSMLVHRRPKNGTRRSLRQAKKYGVDCVFVADKIRIDGDLIGVILDFAERAKR